MSSAVAAAALVVTKRHSLSAAGIDTLYRRVFERLPSGNCRLYIALDMESLADPSASCYPFDCCLTCQIDTSSNRANGLDDDWRNSLIDYASFVYADSQLSTHLAAGGRPDVDVRLLAQFMKPARPKFSLATLCGVGKSGVEPEEALTPRPIKWLYFDGCTAPSTMVDEANEMGIDVECLRVCPPEMQEQKGGLKRKPSQSELLPPPVVERAHSFEGNPIASVPGVVIGGTFDRLHNGHKMLITTAALVATEQFTCGVTDGPAMLATKVLWELIDPVETRVKNVMEFVHDIDPILSLKVVPITDMYGPSITDTNLQLCHLRPYVIGLADDCGRQDMSEDFKVSSWKSRRDMLGTLLRPVKVRAAFGPGRYIIGLTGGICSGKTHIAGDLRELGARVIDCDKMGHQAYKSGSECFNRVVERFGNDVVDPETGEVDRQKLAFTAYSSPKGMGDLSSIVWPEIWKAVTETITHAPEDEHVWVLDAAVLLEAGWHRYCDEIWTAVVPAHEAVRRLKQRNGLTEAQAASRLAVQTDNCSRVAASHVVFTSIWPREQTKMQVKRAWGDLHRRLSEQF